MTVLRRILLCAAAPMLIVAATGCAADPGPGSTRPGIPEGLEIDSLDGAPAGTWIERGESFAIVTMGSSSCPPVVTDVHPEDGDRVVVTFGPSPNDPCTADMSPTTHLIDLPEGITGVPVAVDIHYEDWPETHSFTLE